MAFIKSPECGVQISDKAESCPHCGCPKQYFVTTANKILPSLDARINKFFKGHTVGINRGKYEEFAAEA